MSLMTATESKGKEIKVRELKSINSTLLVTEHEKGLAGRGKINLLICTDQLKVFINLSVYKI